MSVCFQMIDTCIIKRRQATDADGGIGADQYDIYATAEPCLFINQPRNFESQDTEGRDILYDGKLRIEAEIFATDIIVISDIEYKVLIVQPLRDRNVNTVIYYRAYLQRRRKTTAAIEQAEPIIN